MTSDQVQEILDKLNNVGGGVWAAARAGVVAEAWASLAMGALAFMLVAIIGGASGWYLVRNRDTESLDLPLFLPATMGLFLCGMGLFLIVAGWLSPSISCLVAPDWCAVRQLIRVIR